METDDYLTIEPSKSKDSRKNRKRVDTRKGSRRKCAVVGCNFSRQSAFDHERLHSLKTSKGKNLLEELQQHVHIELRESPLFICSRHLERRVESLSKHSRAKVDMTASASPDVTNRGANWSRLIGAQPSQPGQSSFSESPSKKRSPGRQLEKSPPKKQRLQSQSQAALARIIKKQEKEIELLKQRLQEEKARLPTVSPLDGISINCLFREKDQASRWTGISDLDSLFEKMAPTLALGKRQITALNDEKIGIRGLFNMALVWMRRGLSLEELSCLGSPKVASSRLHAMVSAMLPWAKQQIKFHSVEDWKAADNFMSTSRVQTQTIRQQYPDQVFYFVDGSYTPVWEPMSDSVGRKLLWQHKHQCHALGWWVLVDPTGRCVFASHVYAASIGDKEAWNKSNVIGTFQAFYKDQVFGPIRPSIGGDKAYPRIKLPTGVHLHTTKTSASRADLADPVRHVDSAIAPHRAVVERFIMRIKCWDILSNQPLISNQHFPFLTKLFHVIVALTNYELFTDKALLAI
jgi:hypothetical protein